MLLEWVYKYRSVCFSQAQVCLIDDNKYHQHSFQAFTWHTPEIMSPRKTSTDRSMTFALRAVWSVGVYLHGKLMRSFEKVTQTTQTLDCLPGGALYYYLYIVILYNQVRWYSNSKANSYNNAPNIHLLITSPPIPFAFNRIMWYYIILYSWIFKPLYFGTTRY